MTEGESIKYKFREFPPREVAALALRAAMRVLPVLSTRGKAGGDPFAYWPRADRSGHILAILRCYQVSICGHNLPEIDSASIATYRAATSATHAQAATTAAIRAANGAALAISRAVTADSREANNTALAAALTAVHAVRAAIGASAADAALDADIWFFKRNRDIRALQSQPLWLGRMPDEIEKSWLQLIADLRTLNDYYDVWIVWYQERLEGKPMHPALEKRWVSLPEQIRHREPAEINAYLMRLWGDFSHLLEPDDPDEKPPEIPENQQPEPPYPPSEDYHSEPLPSGVSPDVHDSDGILPDVPENQEPDFPFPLHEDDGHGIEYEGYPVDHVQESVASPDEAAETAAMRGVLIKAVDHLVSMTSASERLPWVSDIAAEYRQAITADEPSIDTVYGYGIWLKNAHEDMKAQVVTNDHPILVPGAMAAINTILAIHDAMIASTERGQELMARARDFAEKQAEIASYRLKAQELAAVIEMAQDAAAAKDEHEEIEQANDNTDSGPQQGKT